MLSLNLKHWHNIIKRILVILFISFSIFSLTGCSDADPTELTNEIDEMRVGSGDTGTTAVQNQKVSVSWIVEIVNVMFQSVEKVYRNIIPRVAKGSRPLLGAFFAIWLVIHSIKFFGSLKEPNFTGYWNQLAVKTFWLCFCYYACGNIMEIVDTFLLPIYYSFVELGLSLAKAVGSGHVTCNSSVDSFSSMSSSYVCLVQAIQEGFNGLEDGALAMVKKGPWATIPICLLTYCAAVIMALYFPTLLLDSIVKYGLLMCMVPLGIICMGYRQTRGYAGKVVRMLIGIGFQVVGICLFISMSIKCLNKYLTNLAYGFPSADGALANLVAIAQWFEKSPGLSGFFFIVIFCILFAESALALLDNFGVAHASATAQTIGNMFSVANKAKNVASFAKNRVTRRIDMKDKKKLEGLLAKKNEGKKLNHKETRDYNRLKDKMEAKGYLAKDNNGVLRKTDAYNNLDVNGGMSSYLKGISQDWHQTGTQQMDARQDNPYIGKSHQNNKLADIV